MRRPRRYPIAMVMILAALAFVAADETSADVTSYDASSSGSDQSEPGIWRRFIDWRAERIAATDSYRASSAGVGYAALQDTRMTSLVYRTPAYAAVIQHSALRPYDVVQTTLTAQFALPLVGQPNADPTAYLNPRGDIDVAYLRRFDALPVSVGAGLTLSGNLRQYSTLGNSGFNYDIHSALNATARWQHHFSLLKRPSVVHVRVTTPVVSWVLLYPDFNIAYAGGTSYWAAPWGLYRIRLNVGLSRLLTHSDENRLRLDYSYDVYGTHDSATDDRIVIASHMLTLGYSMKTR